MRQNIQFSTVYETTIRFLLWYLVSGLRGLNLTSPRLKSFLLFSSGGRRRRRRRIPMCWFLGRRFQCAARFRKFPRIVLCEWMWNKRNSWKLVVGWVCTKSHVIVIEGLSFLAMFKLLIMMGLLKFAWAGVGNRDWLAALEGIVIGKREASHYAMCMKMILWLFRYFNSILVSVRHFTFFYGILIGNNVNF